MNKSDKERVIVSFNIMGEPETKAYFSEQIDETLECNSCRTDVWHGTWYQYQCRTYKGYYTMDAMGCMLLKEWADGVERIYSSGDLRAAFPDSDWDYVSDEFDKIMVAFTQIGVDVHLADEKYFPAGHRGVYHTVSNHFYLNRTWSIVHMFL